MHASLLLWKGCIIIAIYINANDFFFIGKTPYKRLGCFQDKGGSRPLPELLFDVSYNASKLVGSQWNYNLLEIVCTCAEEAKQRKYTHFAIQDFGKCYSGPDVKNTYDKVYSVQVAIKCI